MNSEIEKLKAATVAALPDFMLRGIAAISLAYALNFLFNSMFPMGNELMQRTNWASAELFGVCLFAILSLYPTKPDLSWDIMTKQPFDLFTDEDDEENDE